MYILPRNITNVEIIDIDHENYLKNGEETSTRCVIDI